MNEAKNVVPAVWEDSSEFKMFFLKIGRLSSLKLNNYCNNQTINNPFTLIYSFY